MTTFDQQAAAAKKWFASPRFWHGAPLAPKEEGRWKTRSV